MYFKVRFERSESKDLYRRGGNMSNFEKIGQRMLFGKCVHLGGKKIWWSFYIEVTIEGRAFCEGFIRKESPAASVGRGILIGEVVKNRERLPLSALMFVIFSNNPL
jgi:hypothetical protein